ncbi:MAG TPA: CBS domain-containing protein [Desulfobacterales bacterium]|nr:CBS domain-containing protein [Desulfobacterales bacterium]
MSVGQICNRQVVVTSKDSSIFEVAKLMRDHHVGDVIVVDSSGVQPVPIGIITDRDIVVELIAKEVALDSVTVADVMSYDLFTAREQDGIWSTLECMRVRGIRRMPVVNEQGGLEGILTVDDLLELFSEELTSLAKVAIREQNREKEARE